MKKMLQSILFGLLLASTPVYAQQKQNIHATFTMRASPGQPMPDSIQVAFEKGIVSAINNRVLIKVQKMQDGSFTFSIPGDQPVSTFWMSIWYPREKGFSTPYYFADKSDSINILITKLVDTSIQNSVGNKRLLTFSGKGAVKYKVRDLLKSITDETYASVINLYYTTFGLNNSKNKLQNPELYQAKELDDYLESLYQFCRLSSKSSYDTLMKYKHQLGNEFTQFYIEKINITVLDLFCINIDGRTFSCRIEQAIQKMADFYFSKVKSLNIPSESKSIMYDPSYGGVKVRQLMVELFLRNNGNTYPFSEFYSEIKKVKNCLLRDMMLTNLFLDARHGRHIDNFGNRDSCLEDAVKIIKSSELNKLLVHELRFIPGKLMTDFSFADTTGQQVTLKSLKGKVFMLDFYFGGCKPCAEFSKRFEHEVYPEFVNNPNFVSLSVCCDETKTQWMKAIKTGWYNSAGQINVTTGGFDHPLLKKYDIKVFPWVVLVDADGKVISYSVQDMSSSEMKILIRNALDKKKS